VSLARYSPNFGISDAIQAISTLDRWRQVALLCRQTVQNRRPTDGRTIARGRVSITRPRNEKEGLKTSLLRVREMMAICPQIDAAT